MVSTCKEPANGEYTWCTSRCAWVNTRSPEWCIQGPDGGWVFGQIKDNIEDAEMAWSERGYEFESAADASSADRIHFKVTWAELIKHEQDEDSPIKHEPIKHEQEADEGWEWCRVKTECKQECTDEEWHDWWGKHKDGGADKPVVWRKGPAPWAKQNARNKYPESGQHNEAGFLGFGTGANTQYEQLGWLCSCFCMFCMCCLCGWVCGWVGCSYCIESLGALLSSPLPSPSLSGM